MKKRIKQILASIITIVMILTVIPLNGIADFDYLKLFSINAKALSSSGSCGTNVTYTYDKSTCKLIISGTGAMYNYPDDDSPFRYESIKSVVINKGVTSIGDYAFYGCNDLTSISIPDSVTEIGNYSFYGCWSLTSIKIPNSVIKIGDYAFYECCSLTSITIPNSVTGINDSVFEKCTGLTNIIISNGVTSIENSAFSGCISLTSITIPNSVTNIGNSAFSDCISLTSISIPDSVTKIGSMAFLGCGSLISIDIPDGVTSINDSTFEYCENLVSIMIPNSVTSIGDYSFHECYSLTSISIPDSVTSIGYDAFGLCESLTNVTIPNSITSIEDWTFYCCTGLTSITISDSVKSIGDSAFEECNNMEEVYYNGTEEQWYNIVIGNYNDCLKAAKIHFVGAPEHTHTLSHVVIPATCTVNGMEYDICSECGDTFNTVVVPATHKYKHIVEASTCTKTGKEYDKCTVCGAVANEKALPLKAHTWAEWVRTKEPTIDAEGVDTRECSVCHAKETRAVEKLKALVDKNTGVQVVYDDEYSDGVKLEVEETFDGTSFQLINTNYGEVNSVIFDISTTKNGKKVQPDGKVTVRIPVPEGFSGGKIFAVYVDSVNGKTETIPATVVDGYVEFMVEHFSKYALCWGNGQVKSVSIGNDLELKYKDSVKLNPVITADSGVKYTTEYKSSDTKVATVDKNGNVYGAKKGSATITCTVTDEYGNSVSDTCTVKVKYAWWQWIIKIVLFGWIWY